MGEKYQAQTWYPLSLEWPGILIKAAHISDILSLIFKKYVLSVCYEKSGKNLALLLLRL